MMDALSDEERIAHETRERLVRSDTRTSVKANQITSYMSRLFITSLSILTLSILPDKLALGEPECGINRFNNESPLTERIVGGNNSLQ